MLKLSDYLNCKSTLLELGFTEEEIDNAVDQAEFRESDVVDEKKIAYPIPSYYEKFDVIEEKILIKEKYIGDKLVRTLGELIKVPANLQVNNWKVVKNLLKLRFNWIDEFNYQSTTKVDKLFSCMFYSMTNVPDYLRNYTLQEIFDLKESQKEIPCIKSKIKIYDISKNDSKIYLETEFGSLTIPLDLLLKKDFEGIINHTKNHIKSYNDGCKEDIHKLNNVEIFTTPEVLKLQSLLQ